jgi:MSHA biogenesis protein MshP
MFPDPSPARQKGAGLPVALFIITVLALIVLGMAQLQESSGQSISLQIQSQRAFYAAESGAQVGVRNALISGTCASDTIDFEAPGLSSCSASLACESVTADIGGSGGDTVYTIVSRGQCGAGPDQASRSVEVRVR